MEQRKKNMLGAFLLAPVLLTAGVLSVGQTQARYAQTAVYNTVLHGSPGAVRSDCLTSDAKQIIVLGEHPSDTELSVTFTLETTRDYAQRLQWHCSGYAQVDVRMEIWMLEGEGTLSDDHVLQMRAGSRAEVCMTITPTEPVTEPTVARVRVMCGEMEGTFLTTLIPVPELPEEPEPIEPTEPTEPQDPTDPAEPGADETVPTEPAEPTDPEAALLPMSLEQPEDALTQEDPPESPEEGLQIRTFRQIERKDLLPVKLELTGVTADRLVLGLDGGGFPEFTRYSPDSGETWYLLYYGGTIASAAPETAEGENMSWTMMLDLSAAGLEGQDLCLLEARTYVEETQTGSASAQVELLESVERVRSSWVLNKPRPAAPAEPTEPVEPVTEQEPTDPEQPLAPPDPDASFTLPLPVGWEDCEITYEITCLAADETGAVFVPVELAPQSLWAQRGEDPGTLIVWVGQELPAAGKYRLTVTASYEGVCFDPLEETFFINYYPQSDTHSGEVTDHE